MDINNESPRRREFNFTGFQLKCFSGDQSYCYVEKPSKGRVFIIKSQRYVLINNS